MHLNLTDLLPCFTNIYRTNSMPEKPPQRKIAIARADKKPIKMNVKKLFERDVFARRSEEHSDERQEVRYFIQIEIRERVKMRQSPRH